MSATARHAVPNVHQKQIGCIKGLAGAMPQHVRFLVGESAFDKTLPNEDFEVLPGIRWGCAHRMFTAAYWKVQSWMSACQRPSNVAEASALEDELTFCILGGHGISAELSYAATAACRDAGLISERETSERRWAQVLSTPMTFGGRKLRYRFPNLKARYLAGAMRATRMNQIDTTNAASFFETVQLIDGVGLKTAAWLSRNLFGADSFAILDIHIVRAGRLLGLYSNSDRASRAYKSMQARFIEFCSAIDVAPSHMDWIMWEQMRDARSVVFDLLDRAGQIRSA